MKPFCPHCGYDLALDAPILLNEFSMLSQLAPLCWLGNSVELSAFEASLCWTLMKAYPSPVRNDVILERMGSESDLNAVQVFICRIRKKLRSIGAPDPFRATYHQGKRGYAWVLGGDHGDISMRPSTYSGE